MPAFIKGDYWSQDFQCPVYSQSLSWAVLPLKESCRTFPPGRAQIRPDGGPDYQKVSGNRRFTMVCVAEAGNMQGTQMSPREILPGAAPAPQLAEPEKPHSGIVFLSIWAAVVTMRNLWFNWQAGMATETGKSPVNAPLYMQGNVIPEFVLAPGQKDPLQICPPCRVMILFKYHSVLAWHFPLLPATELV